MWILLFKFLLAHFLGDFIFQNKKMVQYKTQTKYFALHITIHAILLCLFLINEHMWIAILIVVLSHALFDVLKLKLNGKINEIALFISDQLLHLAMIAIVVCMFTPMQISFAFLSNPVFWLIVIAVVLATQVSAVVIRILLLPYQKMALANKNKKSKKTIKFSAGTYIGILERLFILGFVIGNFWEGIGFLLAAKSIFRFGDLNNAKERHLTEYVLIGTLLSFGLAIITGLLFNYVLILIQ